MKVFDAVPPHTDSGVKTVINFYIKPNNYKTTFFNGLSASYQIENQTNGKIFDREGLIESSAFIAKDNEAYCLNVEIPHSVDFLGKMPKERTAVCISTNEYNFEQVCNMLCETKYIN
jgi:hypothetical protein